MTTATASSSTSYTHPAPPMSYPPRSTAPLKVVKPARKDIDLAALTPNNINQLRKLNAVLFPVRYSEKWYKDVLDREVKGINRFALFNDIPVGNICARFERTPDGGVNVYIMTLGVLAPYRRLGIASALLKHLVEAAAVGSEVEVTDVKKAASAESASKSKPAASTPAKEKDGKKLPSPTPTEKRTVRRIYLHVQTTNDEARAFYEKNGFQLKEEIPTYYRVGIEPRSAWELERIK